MSTPEVGVKARAALKKDLKNRLRTKIKMHSVGRSGGTSQDVQNVLKKFNDADEEKLELMKDIQDDVKGMKQKDAKKYLKHVLSGMNNEQTDTFVNMVNDKMPSQSANIVNYVKRHKNLQQTEVKTKPQVNPETTYKPTRLMTEDEKKVAKAANSSFVTPKKKKSFQKIQISIPKIHELRDHPTVSTEKKTDPAIISQKDKPKKAFPNISNPSNPSKPSVHDINKLFPELASPNSFPQQNQQDSKRLAFASRQKQIQAFNIRNIEKEREKYIFEAAAVTEVVKIVQVERLPLTAFLPIPETEEFVEFHTIPEKFQRLLQERPFHTDIFDVQHEYGYKKISHITPLEQIKYIRVKNAHMDCLKYLPKVNVIVLWLSALKNKKIPLQWLHEQLYNFGILQQKTENPKSPQDKIWKEYYRLLCHEYMDLKNVKVSSPLTPFLRITYQC